MADVRGALDMIKKFIDEAKITEEQGQELADKYSL